MDGFFSLIIPLELPIALSITIASIAAAIRPDKGKFMASDEG